MGAWGRKREAKCNRIDRLWGGGERLVARTTTARSALDSWFMWAWFVLSATTQSCCFSIGPKRSAHGQHTVSARSAHGQHAAATQPCCFSIGPGSQRDVQLREWRLFRRSRPPNRTCDAPPRGIGTRVSGWVGGWADGWLVDGIQRIPHTRVNQPFAHVPHHPPHTAVLFVYLHIHVWRTDKGGHAATRPSDHGAATFVSAHIRTPCDAAITITRAMIIGSIL